MEDNSRRAIKNKKGMPEEREVFEIRNREIGNKSVAKKLRSLQTFSYFFIHFDLRMKSFSPVFTVTEYTPGDKNSVSSSIELNPGFKSRVKVLRICPTTSTN